MLLAKTILVPVDFSECSINALKYAAGLARINDSRLVILHVAEAGDLEDNLHGNLSTAHLVELLDDDALLKNCRHEFLLKTGSVLEEILRQQKKLKAGLIVMGTQGANSRSRKFFGTNTTAVITKANAAVLAVPGSSVFNGFKKVVLATDQNKKNLKMIEPSVDMIKAFEPEIMLLYVDGDADPSVETTYLLSEVPRGIKKHITYPNTTMYVSSHQQVNEGIEHFVKRKKADLLIMITSPRSFLQSVINKSKTKKMAINSPSPLLAVPNPG